MIDKARSIISLCNGVTSPSEFTTFCTVFLAPPVNLIEPPPVKTQTAGYGMTVKMSCRTDLEPPVKYLWSKLGGELPRDTRGQTEVPSTLVIHLEFSESFISLP